MRALFDSITPVIARLDLPGLGLALLKATIILLAVQALLRAAPRLSAATRHLALTLALGSFVAIPVLVSVLPGWQVPLPVVDALLPSATEPAAVPSDVASMHALDAVLPAAASRAATGTPDRATTRSNDDAYAAPAGAASPRGASEELEAADAGDVLAWRSGRADLPEKQASSAVLAGPASIDAASGGSSFGHGALEMLVGLPWLAIVASIWMLGALLLIGQMLVGFARMNRVIRRSEPVVEESVFDALEAATLLIGLKAPPDIVVSPDLSVPVTGGLARPVVILPVESEGWSPSRLRVVLMHELAHLRRWDHLTLLLNRVAVALFWFHPLVWRAERSARLASECAADDLVLGAGSRASDYAAHLLAIARSLSGREPLGAVTVAMARTCQLEGRLLAILNPRIGRRAASRRQVALFSALLLALLMPLASLQLQASVPDDGAEAFVGPVLDIDTSAWGPDAPATVSIPAPARAGIRSVNWTLISAASRATGTPVARCEEDEAAPVPALAPDAQPPFALIVEAAPLPETSARPMALPSPAPSPEVMLSSMPEPHPVALVSTAPMALPRSPVPAVQAVPSVDPDDLLKGVSGGVSGGISGGVNGGVNGGLRFEARSPIPVARRHDDDDDAREPRTGAEWFNRGMQMHGADRYPEAIEAFKKSIDLKHRETTAMYNIACGYALMNNADEAVRWLDRAYSSGFEQWDLLAKDSDLDPIRSDARFQKLLEQGRRERGAKYDKDDDRLQEARDRYDALKSKGSRDAGAWQSAGFHLLLVRDLDKGIDAMRRSLELDPDQPNTVYNIACGYSLKGDRNEALDWLDRSIEAGFDSADKLRHDPDLANIRGESRFAQLAELAAFYDLSRFRKNDKGWHKDDYSKKRWAPAIVEYDRFVRENPRRGRGWHNYGWALHHSSEHARAAEAFQHAFELGYRRSKAAYNVACAYSMLDRRDEAFQWLQRAVDVDADILGYIEHDDDLDNLRDDARFDRFEKMAEERHERKHKDKKEKKDKEKQKEKKQRHDEDHDDHDE